MCGVRVQTDDGVCEEEKDTVWKNDLLRSYFLYIYRVTRLTCDLEFI